MIDKQQSRATEDLAYAPSDEAVQPRNLGARGTRGDLWMRIAADHMRHRPHRVDPN